MEHMFDIIYMFIEQMGYIALIKRQKYFKNGGDRGP